MAEHPRLLGSQVSVRTRITFSMALLTTLALLTAGVVIWTVESTRRDVAVVDSANQEVAELRKLVADPVDPATGQRFTTAEALLKEFLARNIQGPNEMLALWTNSDVPFVTPSPQSKVVREKVFTETVSRLQDSGGSARVDTTYGEVLLTVQPVIGAEGPPTALVVVSFLDLERESLNSLMRSYLVVALLAMLLITGLAATQTRRLLRPLRDLSETAREIGETDLSRRVPETGNDDITALTRTINEMLDRLENAFSEQRQFLDDAGHELRTPLTVLSGHLELLDVDDPEEVEATRALLLDEVERMSRLVDDLILLAKSRRPDFVTPRPVDLDELTTTVLAKARAMAERDWRLDATAPARLQGDEQRLTQALLQLVDNAVKHTDPGDTIAVGSSVDGSHALLWVRDTGDGIDPADRTRVLERFARSAVRSDDEGFGLGLSIVSAIVEAHGGTVRIDDAEGGGTTVTLALPLEETEEVPWPTS